jgi:hypothetical protein
LNKEEIRFQILYFLYNKHHGGEIGKYQSADDIIEGTELNGVDRNLINDEFVYLNKGGYLRSQRDTSDGGIPYSAVITKLGIDIVETVTQQILINIDEQHQNDDVHNEIWPINNETNQSTKTKKIWEYVKSKQDLFNNIGEKILQKNLH